MLAMARASQRDSTRQLFETYQIASSAELGDFFPKIRDGIWVMR
jgi:hypothetical protein